MLARATARGSSGHPPEARLGRIMIRNLRMMIGARLRALDSDTNRWLPIVLVLVLSTFVLLFAEGRQAPGDDYWRPWAAARALTSGAIHNVYNREGREELCRVATSSDSTVRISPREHAVATKVCQYDSGNLRYPGADIVHTPALLSFVHLLSTGRFGFDHRVFVLVSVLCFLWAVYTLARLLGFSRVQALLAAVLVGLTLEGEAEDLRMNNVNQIQLALLAGFLAFQSRSKKWADLASGLILGIAIAFKPNLALVPITVGMTWVGCRQFHKLGWACLGLGAGGAFAVGFSSIVLSAACWSNWLRTVGEFVGDRPMEPANLSLQILLTQKTGMNLTPHSLVAMLLLVAYLGLRPLWSRKDCQLPIVFARTFAATSLGPILMLMSSRLVWTHYMILAIPGVLFLVRSSVARGGLQRWLGVIAYLPLTTGAHKYVVQQLQSWSAGSMVTQNVGAMLMLAGVLWELNRLHTRDVPSTECHNHELVTDPFDTSNVAP